MLKQDFQLVFSKMVGGVEYVLAIGVIKGLVSELGDNAEVLSCTSHRPIKVRVRRFRHVCLRSVCCHDFHLKNIVAHEAGIPLVAAKLALSMVRFGTDFEGTLTSQNLLPSLGPQHRRSRSHRSLCWLLDHG